MSDKWLEETGGPAFPCPQEIGVTNVDDDNGGTRRLLLMGMFMRDWFAAMASENDVQGALEDLGRTGKLNGCRSSSERTAAARYACADAMLAVRRLE